MHILQQAFIGDWHRSLVAAIKAPALLIVAVAAYRVSGRRVTSGLTPVDWLAGAASGAIIGRTATASDASWLTGTAALVTLLITHAAITRLRAVAPTGQLDPPPRILIRDGVPDDLALGRAAVTAADLACITRRAGSDGPPTSMTVVQEASGSISVLRRSLG